MPNFSAVYGKAEGKKKAVAVTSFPVYNLF